MSVIHRCPASIPALRTGGMSSDGATERVLRMRSQQVRHFVICELIINRHLMNFPLPSLFSPSHPATLHKKAHVEQSADGTRGSEIGNRNATSGHHLASSHRKKGWWSGMPNCCAPSLVFRPPVTSPWLDLGSFRVLREYRNSLEITWDDGDTFAFSARTQLKPSLYGPSGTWVVFDVPEKDEAGIATTAAEC